MRIRIKCYSPNVKPVSIRCIAHCVFARHRKVMGSMGSSQTASYLKTLKGVTTDAMSDARQ